SLGNITFTDYGGNVITNFAPKEFSVDVAYSRLFSDVISASLTGRFIYSNLTGNLDVGGSQSHPGLDVATDLSVYYQNNIVVSGYKSDLSFGLNLSNIGGKIGYTEETKVFIPMNMRLGSALKMNIDDYNSLMFTADLNKLLVPTPPYYYLDSLDSNGDQVIEAGKSPDVSVPVALFQSFYDAPGVLKSDGTRSVFREELREITYSIGAEYWYANQFAVRAGYFHEHATKGNRKYFTFGIGLKMNVFGLDVSYLIPTIQHHPLENTLRFTLLFDIDAFSNQE
ncbi:MAG: type IX secretion system outer membrane channel protein PorV, partial [Chlorobi bacterium]|nr:type IX secretion system outer membrane channel protein PorV [Chlorobiota bacterium]